MEAVDEYFVEEKSGYEKLLDFLVFIAVFAVTIFLILELLVSSGKVDLDIMRINAIYFYVAIVVFVIYGIDLIRLWGHSNGLKDFFVKNWLDILATVPFGLLTGLIGANYNVLNALKLARVGKLASGTKLVKVARISKIGKEFKAAAHLKTESDEYKKKHRL